MIRLQKALIQLAGDLRELQVDWALIGGLAVSLRGEPRTTRDLDVVIAVADDSEAERIFRDLGARGYRPHATDDWQLEQAAADRLAMLRMLMPEQPTEGVVVDLMFYFSGIEPEIVAAAELVEVSPGFMIPVAQRGHLLALKALAGRGVDHADFRGLLPEAETYDLQRAREAAELIDERGTHPEQSTLHALEELLRGR